MSNATAEQVAEARSIAPVVSVQNMYNLANRDDEFVAGYGVLDLTLTRAIALPVGRLDAQLGVNNLADVTRATLVPSMPGRTVFASLGLSF